jgi:hypothetical protein
VKPKLSHALRTVGNTVGSLSGVQNDIIIGSLLGDGAMRCKTNALLEINHSVHQRSYVDWKYRALAELVSTPPKERKGNGSRIAYRFVTRSLPILTPFYRSFYGSGLKRVPEPEIQMSPLALAVWFMDDGCRSRSAVYLNTQQFDMHSQFRLMRMLRKRFGFETTLNRDRIYYRIRLTVRSTSRFVSLVEPFVLLEMRYKLPQVTP